MLVVFVFSDDGERHYHYSDHSDLVDSLVRYLLASGNTLNIISLSSLSIAIGMVVDDAIVVLENITTHIEKR